ncbi:MAG: DnaA/Hda family protein, partial [Planctomycetota bacterium]
MQFSLDSTPRLNLFGDDSLGSQITQNNTFFVDQNDSALKFLFANQPTAECHWPMLLMGPNGTGKTAIAVSIAADIAGRKSSHVTILTATNFRRRFDNAIETNSVTQFRQNILASDAILIDGLQELAGYEKAQLELCNVLDQLIDLGCPTIITFTGDQDRLNGALLPRLISRVSVGLCLSIKPPSQNVR